MYPPLVTLFFVITVVVSVSWTATPFNPLSVPLAVRSPYLSCWLPGGNNGGNLAGQWAQLWTGTNLSWAGYVRVDNVTYVYMGAPSVPNLSPPLVTQRNLIITATQSTFIQQAGPVNLTVSFLSPIEPNDLVRQSLPFSYMTVSATSNDGAGHDVQIYSDISAEWATGNDSYVVTWTTNTEGIITAHQIRIRSQDQEWAMDTDERARWGDAFYAVAQGGTYQSGADVDVRTQFINYGVLTNGQDTNYRSVSDNWPVFGHAFDFGDVSSATQPIVFAVGYVTNPCLQYIIANGTWQQRHSYFFGTYDNALDALSFFLWDYNKALSSANAFDIQVQSDAAAISQDYASIVVLSARQAFGTTELTIGSSADDVLMFMKQNGANTVDVLFSAYPIFLYSNPDLAAYLLEPLLLYQAFGQYPNAWAVHDLGDKWPSVTGHNDGKDEAMPIEESGNMLIMTAAYIKGNASFASPYYSLLQQWTSYLITNCLIPGNQDSTDNFVGTVANQTNLAIKGILGIGAMAQIATALSKTDDAQNYSSIAQSYAALFQVLATSKDGTHLVLSYGTDSSWGLTYNLYADRLLETNIFPKSIYDMQTAWYPNVHQPYGVPLDNRNFSSKTEWEIFMSAAVTSNSTRDLFIESVVAYQKAGLIGDVFPDVYDTNTGGEDPSQFRARATVGGHFAHLVLGRNNTGLKSTGTSGGNGNGTSTNTANTSGSPGGRLSVGALAGIVVGAIAGFLLALLLACYLIWRLRKARRNQSATAQAIAVRARPELSHPALQPTPFMSPVLPTVPFVSSAPVSPYAISAGNLEGRNGKSARRTTSSFGIHPAVVETHTRGGALGSPTDDPQLAQQILDNAPTVDLVIVLNDRLRREQADNLEDPPEYD